MWAGANRSARSPNFSTQQSNGNYVGNGDGNKVARDEESDGKGGKSNGDGNEGGGRATKRAMRVAGEQRGDGEGGKGNCNGNEDGRQQIG